MKEQIKKVQDYFKDKMLSGSFEVSKLDEYTVEIMIDSEYKFVIFTACINIPESFKNYTHAISFMDIQLTDEESIKFSEILLPVIILHKKETLLLKKMQELDQLKSELVIFNMKNHE